MTIPSRYLMTGGHFVSAQVIFVSGSELMGASIMNNDFLKAINEAMLIAKSAYALYEVIEGRRLYGFEALPSMYVVGAPNITELGLSVLIVEQAAITQAQRATDFATQALNAVSLRETPTQGGVQ
jgi:hypothetical protein